MLCIWTQFLKNLLKVKHSKWFSILIHYEEYLSAFGFIR